MKFLIGLFVCFVLSLCGFALVNEWKWEWCVASISKDENEEF